MRRSLALIGVVVVAILVAWTLHRDDDDRQYAIDAIDSLDVEGPRISTPLEKEGRNAVKVPIRLPVPPYTGSQPALKVKVLNEASLQAVVGAVVTLEDDVVRNELNTIRGTHPTGSGRHLTRQEILEVFLRLGRSGRTDNQGKVMLPLPESSCRLEVSGAGVFGYRNFRDPPTDAVELRVNNELCLSVIMLDSKRKRPIGGAKLVIIRPDAKRKFGGSAIGSDVEGMARFKHLQYLQNLELPAFLSPAFPVLTPIRWDISLSPVQTKPYRIVLPQTGSVIVRIQDTDKNPLSFDKYRVDLAAFATQDMKNELRVPAEMNLGLKTYSRRLRKDSCQYPHIGLGLFLRITARPRDRTSKRRPISIDLPGPRSQGEAIVAKLTVPRREDRAGTWPRIEGRFLDGQKRPCANAHIDVEWYSSSKYRGAPLKEKIQLDGAGRFQLTIREPWFPGLRRICYFVRDSKINPAYCEIDLSRDFPPGVNDIGTLELSNCEFLASGTVVDSQGEPLANVWVTISQKDDGGLSRIHCVGIEHTDKKGNFELFSRSKMGRFSKNLIVNLVRQRPYREKSISFVNGSRDLRLIFTNGAEVHGSVTLEAGQQYDDFWTMIEGEKSRQLRPLMPDGTFRFFNLKPGNYKVSAWIKKAMRAVHIKTKVEVCDVSVGANTINRDSRLQGLNIGKKLGCVRFRILNRFSRPIGVRQVLIEQGANRIVLSSDQSSTLSFYLSIIPGRLFITVPGYRRQSVNVTGAKILVILQDGIPICVETGLDRLSGESGHCVQFRIRRKIPALKKRSGITLTDTVASVDNRGKVRFTVSDPGVYLVQPGVKFMNLKPGRAWKAFGSQVSISISDVPHNQVFRMIIPLSTLTTFLRDKRK